MGLGIRLRELRGRRRQADIVAGVRAMGVDFSRSYLSRIERGEIDLPSLPVLRALARVLNTSAADLLHAAGYLETQDLPDEVYAYARWLAEFPAHWRAMVIDQSKVLLAWIEAERMRDGVAEGR